MARHESETHRRKRLLEDMVRELRNVLVDAHDGHIYGDDDEHPDDCHYCALTAKADALLAGADQNLGLYVGGKAMAPPPFETQPVTIIGFRYHTGRHSGRTAMVADYITHDGKQAFDAIERMKPL